MGTESTRKHEAIRVGVARTIHSNLMSGGTDSLAAKIIAKSGHAAKGDLSLYPEVSLDIVEAAGSFDGGIWIQPRLKADVGRGINSQGVTPKLERLTQDAHEQLQMSTRVWDGIDDEQKLSLIEWAIEDRLEKYTLQKLGCEAALRGETESLDAESEEHYLEQAKLEIKKLEALQYAVRHRKAEFKFDAGFAAYGARPKS